MIGPCLHIQFGQNVDLFGHSHSVLQFWCQNFELEFTFARHVLFHLSRGPCLLLRLAVIFQFSSLWHTNIFQVMPGKWNLHSNVQSTEKVTNSLNTMHNVYRRKVETTQDILFIRNYNDSVLQSFILWLCYHTFLSTFMYFSTVTKMKKRFTDEENKRIGTPHWIVSHELKMCSSVTCSFSFKYLS
jgi:hypothetical protein